MGITIDGIVSGLDTTSIIEQLMQLERKPIDKLNTRIETANKKKTAFLDLSARLLAMQINVSNLASSGAYTSTSVKSSAESVLSASGSGSIPIGAYSFRVARLAQSEQRISGGFIDADRTAIGAGSMTIELGNAGLERPTRLDFLNGQTGVSRGSIKITDRSGASAVVDLSMAVDVRDVIEAINAASVSIAASADGDRLLLTDTSGGAGNLSVAEVSGGRTARDLGILQSVAGATLAGSNINYVNSNTLLERLNDGRGVQLRGGDDFRITTLSGATIDVDAGSTTTLGGIVNAIMNDSENAGKVTATISGKKLVLTDNTAGVRTFSVIDLAGNTASDLGIAQTSAGNVITGSDLIPTLDSILLRSLNGGAGISSGSFKITDRLGGSATFTPSDYNSLQELLDAINSSGAVNVTASLNREGHGIMLTDDSGGTGALKVEENGSMVAAELGILTEKTSTFKSNESGTSFTDSSLIGISDDFYIGAAFLNKVTMETATVVDFDGATGKVTLDAPLNFTSGDAYALTGVNSEEFAGKRANFAYIGDLTRLSTLNGGKGVYAGKMKITDGDGKSATIDLSQADDIYIEDVISEINASGTGIVASVNSTGTGILLTDTSAGTGSMRVEEVGGTTAKDLNILGVSGAKTIDGSFRYTITTDANDTLNDLRDKINALGIKVKASVINDGSAINSYRLSLTSEISGTGGRLVVDGRELGVNMALSSRGQDAAVVFGASGGGASPTLIESSTNTITGLVQGLTVNLLSTSASPVTVTVTRDTSALQQRVKDFVAKYNELMSKVKEYTKFDMEAGVKGVLLGDTAVLKIQTELSRLVTTPVKELPSDFNSLRAAGITFSQQGALILDEGKLATALADNPDKVEKLFSMMKPVELTTKLADLNKGKGVKFATAGDDFEITRSDGVKLTIKLSGAKYIRDIIDKINSNVNNSDGKLAASISSDGRKLILDDYTGGSGTLSTKALNGSVALSDLGLARAAVGARITGRDMEPSGSPGIARRLMDRLDYMTKADGGLVALSTGQIDKQVELLNKQISDLEDHLAKEEERLKKQFTHLEQILANSQSTMNWLQSSLSSLSGLSQKKTSSSS
jgi:flagellar hook-associated protein 2